MQRADAEAWLRAELNQALVAPIPFPKWLSPRAELARQLILMGDQSRLRARVGIEENPGWNLNDLAYEYDRLSR